MELYIDLEGEDTLSPAEKKEQEEVITAIGDALSWIKRSPYQHCFGNSYVILHDTPVNDYAYCDVDLYTKSVYVSINLYALTHEYHQQDTFIQLIFKRKDISLSTYLLFFLFHELGHLVHAQLVISGHRPLYEKFIDYHYKYLSYIESLPDLPEELDVSHPFFLSVQKRYRQLPLEKAADSFAFCCLRATGHL